MSSFTPREIVSELDRHVVGQGKAKRAVAIALRNRFRRQQVAPELRDEIIPKNIIMIGPTGVGKTEIARRLAKLAQAPFVKVEASKFTEVGYVGRDVESMIRDLVEQAIQLVRKEAIEEVQARAEQEAERELICLLSSRAKDRDRGDKPTMMGPFMIPGNQQSREDDEVPAAEYNDLRKRLRAGEFEDRVVEIEAAEQSTPPLMTMLGGQGGQEMDQGFKDMLGKIPGLGGGGRKRKLPVSEAREQLKSQAAERLIDTDKVQQLAVERTQESGIVFLDEIDKVASRQGGQSMSEVSREGVQRDLLPIVEGSTVSTRYGPVKTDHILFVAAGAFHVSKVSDLIPELQGRFPVRVELEALGKEDFVRILTEPRGALTRQYEALIGTENVKLLFSDEAIETIASYAADANEQAENIGARRLHTVMEALLEELCFTASELTTREVRVDAEMVRSKLEPILQNDDLARYIL